MGSGRARVQKVGKHSTGNYALAAVLNLTEIGRARTISALHTLQTCRRHTAMAFLKPDSH